MMMNLGIRQFQVKCGFGNAMFMELRDFEDVNEMLECADNFMEQTVEPEGKAGAVDTCSCPPSQLFDVLCCYLIIMLYR